MRQRLPEDLIGLPEFTVLALQRLDPLALVRARAAPKALVPLGLTDLVPECIARKPIFAAIGLIAAHCEACSPRWSKTIRTAQARTSAK